MTQLFSGGAKFQEDDKMCGGKGGEKVPKA